MPAANDDSSAIEEASHSGAASSVGSSSSAINSEDLALLKRWLGNEVQENEKEKESINKLILREDGLYTQTLDQEHFSRKLALKNAVICRRPISTSHFVKCNCTKIFSN
ncbi:hypothetical protein [Candidatus Symbiopectobacterium sp. 'North America']|uniref:hypothetical protein n=1 Tax=Candidatus Symbiopectobacterium sp. 'North America' TaxID=2794574 RepID=UPI001B3580FA|nr:hypothetical protein [Candidatus Symbiopectobacterium sp. 'North America']